MAGKKHWREVEKLLTDLGYTDAGPCGTSNPHRIFTHPSAPDLSVNPALNEVAARRLIRDLRRQHGVERKSPKRNASVVKERQARERAELRRAAERLETERAQVLAQRDALLGGAGARLTDRQINALEARVREIETAQRELERLMVEPPVAAAHQGRTGVTVKHRAGAR